MKNLYIVCYDIADNKARTKIEKSVSGYGRRVQYSIFECYLDSERKSELTNKLQKIFSGNKTDENIDSIRIYRLCEACRGKIVRMGLDRSVSIDYIII